jgi:hypothetical protein
VCRDGICRQRFYIFALKKFLIKRMSERQKALWGLVALLGLGGWLIGGQFAEWGINRLVSTIANSG